MTSINDVRLVGRLTKTPEFHETAAKKKFARLSVETEKFMRVNGERRRITAVHTVLCFNQFSLPFLESHGKEGIRVKILGELSYDRNGKAEVVVSQYNGECGPMDLDENSAAAKPAQSSQQPHSSPSPSKPGGGLGRLNLSRGKDSAPEPQGPAAGSFDDEDDSIPF